MSLDVSLYYKNDGNNTSVFRANITHNLAGMADEAGIYKHIWRPDELNITQAKDLIDPLEKGLIDLVLRPSHYTEFNAANGWGKYEDFVPWVAKYLEACKKSPGAFIDISR